MHRIGMGTDSHAFADLNSGKRLVLGSVEIPGEIGLVGDSDGDVILHAAFNAIMSALGEQGLGFYFNKNNMDKYGHSTAILEVGLEKMHSLGFRVGNISITLEGKKPRLQKHIPSIQEAMSALLHVLPACVGITITSGDGLTSFGKGEGLYCQAVVLLEKI
ncbi:MAG: 2-C-methyl-D-erythritol 2,4-cyclodiphosphate synthase [Candidatus Diapherotrites archaeon]|uniref:2-C-methyl-D-erythritol 2,4-cyclodiphosphate synthase n=1 Tax=Candidatus Iainarchaeum sp. TaxID=3101447 RepID=A0A8T4C828_9ARCH|nr:2-C-methyl-D-erythritol 2,4-cyclodiphosphate synthase [Candidatus Diapherotrites archaeon]